MTCQVLRLSPRSDLRALIRHMFTVAPAKLHIIALCCAIDFLHILGLKLRSAHRTRLCIDLLFFRMLSVPLSGLSPCALGLTFIAARDLVL